MQIIVRSRNVNSSIRPDCRGPERALTDLILPQLMTIQAGKRIEHAIVSSFIYSSRPNGDRQAVLLWIRHSCLPQQMIDVERKKYCSPRIASSQLCGQPK